MDEEHETDQVNLPRYYHREDVGGIFCEAVVDSGYAYDPRFHKAFLCGKAAELYPRHHPVVALCSEHKYLAPKEPTDDDHTA